MTMRRISDPRVAQFWDRGRLVSHFMGEHDGRSIVWDRIAVYPEGAIWEDRPPEPLYFGGPVVQAAEAARVALKQALTGRQVQSH